MGGEIDEASAIFRLSGEALDPRGVSETLGLTPTRSHKKGDPTRSTDRYPHLRHQSGEWLLVSRLPRNVPLDRHLRHLLDQLDRKAEAVRMFIEDGCDAGFFCACFLDGSNRSTDLLPSTLGRIAALGARLNFDIHCPEGNDEDDQDGPP